MSIPTSKAILMLILGITIYASYTDLGKESVTDGGIVLYMIADGEHTVRATKVGTQPDMAHRQ